MNRIAVKRCFFLMLIVVAFATPRALAQTVEPLFTVVDLDVNESREVKLPNGQIVSVELTALKERRDSISSAVREARVTVRIDGQPYELTSATYHRPVTVGNVRVDCAITEGYNSNGRATSWGLNKAARLRLWPADSPLLREGTFGYPVKQRWFATHTQMANVPTYVDGGESPKRQKGIYYHSGLDIGGAEKLVPVVAATDGLIVSVGDDVLKPHDDDTPVSQRYDVVYILDARGWYYRYSHLASIDPSIKLGDKIKLGAPVGMLGKEGGSGGWSHLHFEIKARQPSGQWGTQEGYAFLWEAYQHSYKPKIIAVARPHHYIFAGETVELDASKSWTAADRMVSYDWRFDDGAIARGPRVTRQYNTPGSYSEIMKVTDSDGNAAYDFGVVQVQDPDNLDQLPPTIHPVYYPTHGIRVGDTITFKVRTFRTFEGAERWDFADGSPIVTVHSDGNAVKHAPNGYAVTTHSYTRPGDFIVRVERINEHGVKAVAHLHVHVEP